MNTKKESELLTTRLGQKDPRAGTFSNRMSATAKCRFDWLGTPWTPFVLAVLTWPALLGFLSMCLKYQWPQWMCGVGSVLIVLSGFLLSGLTIFPAWWRTPTQRMAIWAGSLFAWEISGILLRQSAYVSRVIDELAKLYRQG